MNEKELYHFGLKGMKWGIRRFQNEDGTLTPAGRSRYGVGPAETGPRRADQVANVNQRLNKDYNRDYKAARKEFKSNYKNLKSKVKSGEASKEDLQKAKQKYQKQEDKRLSELMKQRDRNIANTDVTKTVLHQTGKAFSVDDSDTKALVTGLLKDNAKSIAKGAATTAAAINKYSAQQRVQNGTLFYKGDRKTTSKSSTSSSRKPAQKRPQPAKKVSTQKPKDTRSLKERYQDADRKFQDWQRTDAGALATGGLVGYGIKKYKEKKRK